MKHTITLVLLLITAGVSAQRITCKGTTKSGQPCKSIMVSKETGYCRSHNPAAKHCPFVKKDGSHCKMVTDGSICRFHNTSNIKK